MNNTDPFGANLDAIRSRSAIVADLLEIETDPPSRAEPGRDGSPTFRLQDELFLGRCSMPRVRAGALVDRCRPDGGSVLLPTMGNGYEVVELLSRTPDHSAVFVWIDDPGRVRLALRLHDFARQVVDGRLVLLGGDDCSTALTAFIGEHPGYEMPQRLLVPPYWERSDVDDLRRSIEVAGTRVADLQSEVVRRYSESLAARSETDSPIRRLVILSVDPRREVIEAAHALVAAGRRLDIDVTVSIPDRPERAHCLTRLRAMEESHADAVLLLNGGWGPLAAHVPSGFPVATLLLPNARIIAGATDGFSPDHSVFTTAAGQETSLAACGVDEQQIQAVGPAVDDEAFKPLPMQAVHDRFDVLCIGDVHDLRPAACGWTLDTQKILWNHVCEAAVNATDDSPESIFAAALRSTEIEPSEDDVRERFLARIGDRLLPSLRTQQAADALVRAGVDVRVSGIGWQWSRVPEDRVFDTVSTPAQRNDLYNRARVVAFPVIVSSLVPTMLEAMAAGTVVIARKFKPEETTACSELRDDLQRLPTFGTAAELLDFVRRVPDDAELREVSQETRRRVIERHLWVHRLEAVRDALAERLVTA